MVLTVLAVLTLRALSTVPEGPNEEDHNGCESELGHPASKMIFDGPLELLTKVQRIL